MAKAKGMQANVDRVMSNGERWRDVVLVRISLDRENETSTETQEDECRMFSAMHNGDVVTVIVERGQSAYKRGMHREGLERALRMLESGEANRLVVWKLDRLMRDVHDFAAVTLRMQAANINHATTGGVHLVSRTEAWLDTTGPLGYAIAMFMAAVAQIESDNRSDRTTSFLNGRMRELMPPTGRRPFGYHKPSANTLVVNPDEASVVTEMAMRVAAGESMRSLCRDLTARGIHTTNGTRKDGSVIAWSHTGVRSVLMSPTIIACVDVDGVLTPSTKWEPIVTRELWDVVQTVLGDPSRSFNPGKGARTLKHFLAGVIACGVDGCNGVLRPHSSSVRDQRMKCNVCNLSVKMAETESFVSDVLLALIDEDAWEAMRARGRSAERQQLTTNNDRSDFARAQWLAGNITNDEWLQVQSSIKALNESLAESVALDLPDWESLHTAWPTATASDKRTVITTVFESITALPRGGGLNGNDRIKMLVADNMAVAA